MDKQIEDIKWAVMEVIDRYNHRDDITKALSSLGFSLWTYIDGNEDEEIWAYDKGIPNGQILVLINWCDAFVWIYEKKKTISMI